MKLRFAILYPIGIFAFWCAQCDNRSIRQGMGFVIAGLLIRLWANGYAIKMDKLTTSGPYSFVRNPLYLGSFLIVLGFIIMLKLRYVGMSFLLVWILIYIRTILQEETMLEEKFKDHYRDYKREVPRLIPRIIPSRQGPKWSFSFLKIIENKEYKLLFWIFIIFVIFYSKEELGEHKHFLFKQWGFIAIALFLGLVDLWGEFIK